MIQLIVSDLDGTLLQNHREIHPENLRALKKAADMGVRFAVASGRSAAACSVLLKESGWADAYVIGTNGCELMERPFGEMLSRHYMKKEAARAVLEVGLHHGLECCLYTEDAIVYSNDNMLKNQTSYAAQEFARKMRLAGIRVEAGREAVLEAADGSPMKVYCVYYKGQEEAFAKARQACAGIPGISLTSSWIDNFEAMPEGVDKGTAVAELCSRLGIPRGDVLAFGDSDNDLPMLRWAGHAFAMENADEAVKREIPDWTGRCDAGGVAQGICRALNI